MCISGISTLTLRGACLAAGLTWCLGLAHAAGDLRIVISDDRVAIKANNVSVREVFEELSRQSNLVVVSQEALDESVSIDIDQPTLPHAIRRLLRHKNFLLRQSNDGAGRLWIFSADANKNYQAWVTQPERGPDPERDSELTDYLLLASSDDASDRREAMYGFGELGASDSVSYLLLGLSDPDESVREIAIRSLADLGGTEAVMALSIALNDSAANLRVDAVDALGDIGGPEAVALLQGAMADENDTVREVAAEWLTELAWTRD